MIQYQLFNTELINYNTQIQLNSLNSPSNTKQLKEKNIYINIQDSSPKLF